MDREPVGGRTGLAGGVSQDGRGVRGPGLGPAPLRRQLVWITGSKDETEAQAKLRAFTLEGILHRVRIPALITHGVNDEMVPVASAERTCRELGSADKTLRLYTPEDGGDTHINIDNWSQVIPVMADWLRSKLQ